MYINFTFQNKFWGLCPTTLLMKLFSQNTEQRNAGECAEWIVIKNCSCFAEQKEN